MIRRNFILAVATLGLSCSTIQAVADQLLEIGPTTSLWSTTPVSVGNGSESLLATTVYLQSNSGSETPQTYSGTLSGVFHQIAEFGGNVGTPMLDTVGPIDSAIDSHWLYDSDASISSQGNPVLVAGSPSEDFGILSSESPAADSRFGTFLSQAAPGVALSGLTSERFDIAYLVFPSSDLSLSWQIESGSNEGRLTAFSGQSPRCPLTVPGDFQDFPYYPDSSDPDGGWEFTNVGSCRDLGSGLWFDPPAARGFDYAITDGESEFASIGMPVGLGDSNGTYLVTSSEGTVILAAGDTHSFASGVTSFSVFDIDPTVDGGDPLAFPTLLSFGQTATDGTVSFRMTPVPEPTSFVLLGLGLLGLVGFRRRK